MLNRPNLISRAQPELDELNLLHFWLKNHQKIIKNCIFLIFEDAFAAPTGGTVGVARRHLQGLGTRYDKYKTIEKVRKRLFFSEN